MKYHLMADHNNLVSFYIRIYRATLTMKRVIVLISRLFSFCFFQPIPDTGNDLVDQAVKEKLRKVLKRMGKLKCSKEVWSYFIIKM